MSKQKTEVETKEKPKEIPVKDIMVNHHKLGNVKLGSISKNELCRMVKQSLQENQKLQIHLNAANMMLNELKVGELEKVKVEVMKKIEANKKNMEAVKSDSKDLSNSK